MEGIQHHYARSSSYLYDVHTKSMNDNRMWISRSSNTPSLYSCEPSRERGVRKVSKSKSTWWNDPEQKRKRRVAKYKLYAVEGKIKRSVKKGLRSLKIKCIKILTKL